MTNIQPIAARNSDRSKWIKEKVVAAFKQIFPITSNNYTIELTSVEVKEREYSITEQKQAILQGKTLSEPVYADLVIVDNATKKVVEKLDKFKLADIPFLTNRLTMILDGNDYSLTNQLRLKPGIYTRRRDNDVVEAFFNLSSGRNFRIVMDPAEGIFKMEIGTSTIPLYPILTTLGIADGDIARFWGQELMLRNKQKSGNVDVAVTKLYSNLFVNKDGLKQMTTIEKAQKIGEYFAKTKMDPTVNASTINQSVGTVTAFALLNATKKVLKVLQDKEMSDDKDNLKYQVIHTIDDAISENILKTSPEIVRKLKFKLDSLPKGKNPSEVMSTNPFGAPLKKFIATTPIASPLPQINPVDIIGNAYSVTHLGPGAIKDIRMVRQETRQINSSHMGIIDPVNTKENEKAGIALFATPNSFKDKDGNIYTRIVNVKDKKAAFVSAYDLEHKVIAFPNEDLTTPNKLVEVVYQGKVQRMPASKVEYQFQNSSQMFSTQTNLIPFVNSISGIRALMAAKHYAHALPLKEREAPLVQSKSYGPHGTEEKYVASLFLPKARANGVVKKITGDEIHIKGDAGEKLKDVYETNFPLNQKTFLHTELKVGVGDQVKKNQILGDSIYTKGGELAMGTNLNVGYINYKGLNVNDGVVVSEAAAKKLTSLHMNKFQYDIDDNHFVDRNKFTTLFPNKFPIGVLANLDQNGVVKKGAILKEGDPLVLGIEKTELSAEQSMLGKLHKKLYVPYREDALVWDNVFQGEVTDVFNAGNRIMILIRSEQPAQVGDKISQRSASKGVITAIVKDEEMFRDESGKPLEVLMSPTVVVSRQNPAQILETAAAKVAAKIGKPVVIDNFGIKDNHAYVADLMKQHGIKDKEDIYDPKHDRTIKGVMVGPQYILKQSNQVDTGFSARNIGQYDSNELPTKGGEEGSKTIGMLDINSLLSHNARNILQEVSTVKGTKNTEFWNAYMNGQPLPSPKVPFAYDKFTGMVHASGIKLNKADNMLIASPLTDRDTLKMSNGEVTTPYTVRAKDLRPEEGGLYDPGVTGGPRGQFWSHIKLAEPVINPVMKKPVQTLLGKTAKGLEESIRTIGVGGIQKELSKIDVEGRVSALNAKIPTLKGNELDKAVKELKYLKGLQTVGLKPHEAYVMNYVPVLPPIMRPIAKMPGSNDLMVSASNRLYSDIIHTNNAMAMTKGSLANSDMGDLRSTMQQSVDALVGVADSPNYKLRKQGLKGILSTVAGDIPKQGYFQSKVLSKPQDLAGRAVIIPDPRLSMDHVGVPEEMLWVTYKPMIVQRLVKKGYPSTTALEMVDKKDEGARMELLDEIKQRPVLINRAPNLHKYNIVGAYAVPTQNKTITISPFMEKAQGADFDGDAMQLHVPVSHKAVQEAKGMTMSNILFADKFKSNNLIAKPELDTNYGLYRGVNSEATGKSYTFNTYDEMKQAYKNGKIGLNDKVTIKEK